MSRRLPDGLPKISQLDQLLSEHSHESDQVAIGIETDRWLTVAALVAAGYQVYATNLTASTCGRSAP